MQLPHIASQTWQVFKLEICLKKEREGQLDMQVLFAMFKYSLPKFLEQKEQLVGDFSQKMHCALHFSHLSLEAGK